VKQTPAHALGNAVHDPKLTLFLSSLQTLAPENKAPDQAALLTPQKNGSGPFAIPVIFLRQA
jgi:hypothetical protein